MGEVKISDFGIARIERSHLTQAGDVLGTPFYMAPEQLQGKEVTTRSDIYALGLVLYELFTGKRVYEAKTLSELLELHERSTPPTPSSHVKDIDPLAERVILRCLESEPSLRPASAVQVALALPGGDPLQAGRLDRGARQCQQRFPGAVGRPGILFQHRHVAISGRRL